MINSSDVWLTLTVAYAEMHWNADRLSNDNETIFKKIFFLSKHGPHGPKGYKAQMCEEHLTNSTTVTSLQQ